MARRIDILIGLNAQAIAGSHAPRGMGNIGPVIEFFPGEHIRNPDGLNRPQKGKHVKSVMQEKPYMVCCLVVAHNRTFRADG